MDKNLKNRIKAKGLELGLDLIGVAPFKRPPHTEAFLSWLNKDFHGEMHYMARTRERRVDPFKVFPEGKSVIVGAISYALKYPIEKEGFLFSRYVGIKDYHKKLHRILKKLFRFIKEAVPDAKGKIYVDTGPILEREFARLAGLGWIGKNTNLIAFKKGSYFLLGEILLNIPLEPDLPEAEHCGKCTRCIDACPTGAIEKPWVLDARKCISYLTIEYRGWIPQELRPQMGKWVFGCDICQEVCPWNQKIEYIEPERGLNFPGFKELLEADDEKFRELLKGSAMKRAGRDGLLRNMLIAIGNMKDKSKMPLVLKALKDRSPIVRGHAAWAIAQLGEKGIISELEKALELEKDPYAKIEIVRAIEKLKH